jgi:hypothetical protein
MGLHAQSAAFPCCVAKFLAELVLCGRTAHEMKHK